MIIDGKAIAARIVADLKPKFVALEKKRFFGAVLVGDDPASLNFLKQKEKVAQELGVEFRLYNLPADIMTDALREEIGRLAGVKQCGGFIVQLPFPAHLDNKHYVLNAIPKEKDVDVLSESALGAFYTGRNSIVPPSVATVRELLVPAHQDLRAMTVAVIGAGFLIGKPIGFWLQNRVAELMVFDSSVKNLRERLKDADIVISGVGHADLFRAEDLKEGAMVIDFGWNRVEGKITGDFTSEGADAKNISYTPTPGGTGPVLVAKLLENFYLLNSR